MKENIETHLCCIGGVVYCERNRQQIGITLYLDEEDKDTIRGYDCEYPNCYSDICKLLTMYPIGSSHREAANKIK